MWYFASFSKIAENNEAQQNKEVSLMENDVFTEQEFSIGDQFYDANKRNVLTFSGFINPEQLVLTLYTMPGNNNSAISIPYYIPSKSGKSYNLKNFKIHVIDVDYENSSISMTINE